MAAEKIWVTLKIIKEQCARVITEILKQSFKKSAPNTIHTGRKLFSQLPLLKNRELFLFGHLSGLGDLFAFGWVCFGVVGSWCWLGLFQLLLWLVPSSVPCGAGSGARGFIMVCSWSSVFFLFFFFLCGHKGPPAAKMPWGWSSVSFFQCEELYFACCMIIMFVDYLFAYGDELITSIYFQKQEAHALEKASYLKCH